ncbi:retrovirus-related pol polyprotein from transposon TNT 1-94 [Tanacetum coccineum]|uniref:Retrovirus-related pol polyprotein from transposon TNT 1-94 n=1 Tax=Tanacetum coccineum TaxID=301880 RepID=A0ABQ5AIN6_9ASTR
MQIAQKEEAGIQLTSEEFEFMAAIGACEETKKVTANYRSAKVQLHDKCYNDEIFNMFTQEEQYTDLLEPILEPHLVQQNDNNVISDVTTNMTNLKGVINSLFIKNNVLLKKINALHLSSGKQITALNEEISNLNKQLSMEKSAVSSLLEEKKRLKSDFKIHEDELLDKQILLENKIKELDNILVKTGQSIQTMHMLSPKPDSFYHTEQKMALGYQIPFYLKQAQQKQQSLYNGKVLLEKHDPPIVHDSEETLQLAQESHLKMKQLNKEIKPANYTKINHLSGVFVSQMAKSREESYFLNTSKTATVSKSISIPNEEFSNDATPSVARKFLNEKVLKDEIFPIVNQVDARLQNFEIQFLKEAADFVRDFKSLANEADESLDKQKTLEREFDRLLKAVVSQEIMSIVQDNSVVDTSNLQTELARTKESFEKCIIQKDTEYTKLWNEWHKKCEECKNDKISYDKAYNDMKQTIERLQAQLGNLKGKSKDTSCASDTLDPLSQKLENENVELEFQVSEQKDKIKGTSVNTKFANQSILGIAFLQPIRNNFVVRQPNAFQSERLKFSNIRTPQKVDKTNDLSKPVTSNLVPSAHESKVVNITKVIALGRLRMNPTINSRVDKFVPNKHVKASVRTNPITGLQPHIITKNDVTSKTNGFSPKDIKCTTRTRRPQPRNNHMSDKVPFKSKSSCLSNELEKIEENHRRSKERLASPKPRSPRSCFKWSPTGRMFDLKGKIITTSESVCQSDCSKGDNACTPNPQEPIIKRFPVSIVSMTGCQNWFDTLLIPLLSDSKPGLQGMASAAYNSSGPAPQHQMTLVHSSSSLGPHSLWLVIKCQIATRASDKRGVGSNTLSWKPCQGDSSKLNLPDHRIRRRCCSLIPGESRFKTSCSIDKDKFMMKAQYRGVDNVVAETSWLCNLLRELHTLLFSATLVYCNNVSVIYMTANPVQHQRTKHIEIDIHFVRDMVARGQFVFFMYHLDISMLTFSLKDYRLRFLRNYIPV